QQHLGGQLVPKTVFGGEPVIRELDERPEVEFTRGRVPLVALSALVVVGHAPTVRTPARTASYNLRISTRIDYQDSCPLRRVQGSVHSVDTRTSTPSTCRITSAACSHHGHSLAQCVSPTNAGPPCSRCSPAG